MTSRTLLASGRFWRAVALVAAVILVVAGWMLFEPGQWISQAGGALLWLLIPERIPRVHLPSFLKPISSRGDNISRSRRIAQRVTRRSAASLLPASCLQSSFRNGLFPQHHSGQGNGIGDWSDADFLRAVHQGIARDGEHLYPAFPYDSFTYLTDDDALAIKAYLFSLPPVRNAVPETALSFPFNQRWLMAAWSFLYSPNRRFEPNADRSPEWNRGAYVVEALAHCGECHTPRNLAQALDNRRKFSGAVTAGWRAFNISSDRATGIGAWSDEDLEQYLSTGHAQGHGSAAGRWARPSMPASIISRKATSTL